MRIRIFFKILIIFSFYSCIFSDISDCPPDDVIIGNLDFSSIASKEFDSFTDSTMISFQDSFNNLIHYVRPIEIFKEEKKIYQYRTGIFCDEKEYFLSEKYSTEYISNQFEFIFKYSLEMDKIPDTHQDSLLVDIISIELFNATDTCFSIDFKYFPAGNELSNNEYDILEEIYLLGEKYENVYYVNPFPPEWLEEPTLSELNDFCKSSFPIKFYFNPIEGILGFEDSYRNLWMKN